ncbi:TetR/AcrR family transcriptional regulator [Exilibacterium tricleocarpae]|uniref:TetR/AcrR family transcriptional regulator n=1 Tax=Exilibacterium tricleocarpae TaxID=2591008 RepID=A0A545TNM3_9GAMM|nr:TetR/AcrR family transcriptional regulator [Exilibacterium tricleocarpae]TQV78819.1 TetR/AcrR family transcriptional regulator [Exilibacterium tricleocarpae]
MAKVVDKKRKQAQLVQAAVEVFAARGYQAATMDDVAARANVSKGSLYLYFKNKEALFNEVFLWFGRLVRGQFDAALSNADNELEKLRRIAAVWGEIGSENRHYAPLFLDFWAAASSKDMLHDYARGLFDMYADYRALLEEIVDAGKRRGLFKPDTDTQVTAYLLIGAMDGLFLQCWLAQPDDIGLIMRQSIDTVIAGIAVRG